MPTTDPATTVKITGSQATALCRVATASKGLRDAARDLRQRADNILDRATTGHHLTGFDSDVLGQCGREVQHYASQRAAYLLAAMDCPEAALLAALTDNGAYSQPKFFHEGDTFPLHVETTER